MITRIRRRAVAEHNAVRRRLVHASMVGALLAALALVIGVREPVEGAAPAGHASQVDASDAGLTRWTTYDADPADGFVDTIGVATHHHYTDTAYARYDMLALLDRLGVRQIRDDVHPDSMAFFRAFVERAGPGAGVSYIVDVHNDLDMESQIRLVAARAPGTASQIESDNEPDCDGWAGGEVRALHDRARSMRALMDSLPALRGVPLTTPSLCRSSRADYAVYGDDGASDRFNIHPYPDGQLPGPRIAPLVVATRLTDPGTTTTVTESGYHNAVNATGPGHRPTSEQAESAYLPQMFLEYAANGIALTHAYELIDQRADPQLSDREQHFGLFRADGTIKPAGASLAALVTTLSDKGGPVATRPVRLDISGGGPTLRSQVFARSDGSVDVVLWLAQQIWDPDRRIDLDNPEVEVTVRTPEPATGSYVRIRGAEDPERALLPDGDVFTVPVSAHPTIVRIGQQGPVPR